MNSVKKFVIIVAGGTGSRMNSGVPKQMMMLADKPVIIHTIERFINYDPQIEIVVVLHSSLKDSFAAAIKTYAVKAKVHVVNGGDTRFHSVKNGLNAITENEGVVGIHDAARPLVSSATLHNTYETAEKNGNAVPCITISESLRELAPDSNHAVQRERFRIVQTPQCFDLKLVKEAFKQDYQSGFTDDATVFEYAGHKINLVAGNSENIKITLPSDLPIAEALIQQLNKS